MRLLRAIFASRSNSYSLLPASPSASPGDVVLTDLTISDRAQSAIKGGKQNKAILEVLFIVHWFLEKVMAEVREETDVVVAVDEVECDENLRELNKSR